MNSAAIIAQFPLLSKIFTSLQAAGARVYLVGGAVRDMIMDHPITDIDIEVHGVSLQKLQELLSPFGTVHEVGASFGVLKVQGLPVDWSVPRKDSKGRKPQVE